MLLAENLPTRWPMAAPSIGFYVTLGVAQIVMFQEKEPGFVPQNWAKRLLGSSDFFADFDRGLVWGTSSTQGLGS